MLKLRRGVVVEVGQPGPVQRVAVDVGGDRRPAVADTRLLGSAEVGDEVVVNVEARDLGLGSGGVDVVHVNLTRGLDGEGQPGAHVMKLNYTSLQHAVLPVEGPQRSPRPGNPTAVTFLHAQLAPVAWAFARGRPGARLGFVQTAGGALPGAWSDVVRDLRGRGLLAGHLTAGAAYGGEGEAISTAGALEHGYTRLGWDAAVVGPGPGILGSASALGHGGMVALDSAHAALALGCPTILVARMSSGDERARHRGLSHHTAVVLELLLASAIVALPDGAEAEIPAAHTQRRAPADLAGYEASGLPARTMGRGLAEDELFFAAALAGGAVLAQEAEGP